MELGLEALSDRIDSSSEVVFGMRRDYRVEVAMPLWCFEGLGLMEPAWITV